jgi:phosphoribosylglycinamide formyltransferase-1
MSKLKLCVLISGSGTNLQALIDAVDAGRLDAEIVHVISNVAEAKGLERARKARLNCSVIEFAKFGIRDRFDQALAVLMGTGDPDLFIFAGFMRIVGNPVLRSHHGRMINLHPSLLPLYPGLDTYQRAIAAGDRQHGASMHYLNEKLDGGPVIAQVRIPILQDDNSETLRGRLAPQEHRLMVATVELFQCHRVECQEDQVIVDGTPLPAPLLLGEDDKLHYG